MAHPQYKGQGIPIFSFKPNWANEVSLRCLYDTVIREALDNSEERHGRRPRCLYGLQFEVIGLRGQQTGYLRRFLELAQAMPVGMPVWTDECRLLEAVEAGATELSVEDTTVTLFNVLVDYALLWSAFNRWEVVTIEQISDNSITLSEATTGSYGAGAAIVPLLFGKLERQNLRQPTDEKGVFQVNFEERFNGLTDQSIVERSTPDLEYEFDSACRDSFTLRIPVPEGETWRVQVATELTGPWGDHIIAELTGEESEPGVKELVLNNDYNGEHFFRVVNAEGEVVRSAVRPAASVLEPPTIEITNLVDSERPMVSSEGFVKPYSNLENPWITNEGTYVVPRGRKEMVTERGDGAPSAIVSVTGAAGATHTWTRNALNPEIDTPIPVREGVANNLAVSKTDFGFIIKARSFKDGCQSPLTCLLVDRRLTGIEVGWYRALVNSALVTGACDLPNDADHESGASCNLNFGGTTEFEEHLAEIAEDNATLGNGGRTVKSITINTSSRPAWYGDFEMHVVAAGYLAHASSEVHRLGSLWNGIQASWMFGEVQLAGSLDGSGSGIGSVEGFHQTGETMAGPGGSPAAFQTSLGNWINGKIAGNGPLSVKTLDIILTLHHDFIPLNDPTYDPPDAEDPEEPVVPDPLLEIWWESWEEYADTNDAAAATLDGEVGWDGAWSIEDFESPLGVEDFETYTIAEIPATEDTDPLFDELLDDGYGFDESWFFIVQHFGTVFSEDFETYAVDTIDGFSELNGGSGWDGPWLVSGAGLNYSGVETFESYSAATLPNGDSGIGDIGDFVDHWHIEDYAAQAVNAASFTYYRVLVLGNGGDLSFVGTLEFELREAALGTNYAASANGGSATASSTNDAVNLHAGKAIDGSLASGNGWVALSGSIPGEWLRVQLATSRVITKYKLGSYATTNNPAGRSMYEWIIQGSNNGSSWTNLRFGHAATTWTFGEVREFDL